MCGFAGILNDSKLLPKHQVATIASCVSFRGPDSTGVKIFNENFLPAESGTYAFFFNRLAIIDLDARADQPFENDRYLLLFNGEIYNYKELRKKLEGYGVSFRTTSDTEVLFYLLIRFGKEALSLLNGMFSLFLLHGDSVRVLLPGRTECRSVSGRVHVDPSARQNERASGGGYAVGVACSQAVP